MHDKQKAATASDKAIRSLFWGNRVGKTEWGAQEVIRYATNSHPHKEIYPPIEIWCACPSYDQQKETTQKKLESYIPEGSIKDITYVKKNTWGEIILTNDNKINFKSYEQGREKFQGVGKRLIWFDEEPPKDIWEECFVRSEAGIQLDIILTMTAIKGMTWVYSDIYLDSDNEDLYVSTAGWDDNPWLTEKQKEQMARGLSADALKVRREGKFVKRVGMVCPWWDRSTHLIEKKAEKVLIEGAIDFGFSNPCCFLMVSTDYDDNIDLFDGFYEEGLTTPDIGKKIASLYTKHELSSLDIIADSAQAQDIQQLNDYFADKKLNINVIGIKKVSGTNSENWDEYRARRMQEYGEIKNGKSKFSVSPDLTRLDEQAGGRINWFVKEVEVLKWDEVLSPTGEKQQGGRWDSKYPNHAIDAYSYWLVDHLDSPERPKNKKPWQGKVKGTYIPPSPTRELEEQTEFFEDRPDTMWEDNI